MKTEISTYTITIEDTTGKANNFKKILKVVGKALDDSGINVSVKGVSEKHETEILFKTYNKQEKT